MSQLSAGARFRQAMQQQNEQNLPLQIVGTINAYTAMMATRVGHKAVYISGGGAANASYGLPDLGMTSLDNVLEDAHRITNAVDTPLLVDIDTGWGGAFNIAQTIKKMEKAGVAAVHIEDQVAQKRCGHRPNKEIVSTNEMVDRLKAALDAKVDPDFVVMARTDALAVEGLDAAVERAVAFQEAGADMIFAEALTDIEMYRKFTDVLEIPVLANMTEFGQTDLYTTEQLYNVGVQMVLYPLSAFRAMNKAALNVYEHILKDGTQANVIDTMQTRMELYDFLNYHQFEQTLDKLFADKK
ncbi:methylisocitrate lyase [Psychrobacter sp. I-STPA10]|uniref:methylisocitrate lyase n=1 Tax=Psychrobacter sp. I-STPA10 TaxID=2585769 RepID=UPI001E4B5DF0|nr:methylisocitrate lyase [Psychrobacter sp. I-STPA10]